MTTTATKLKPKVELPVKFSGNGTVSPDIWLEQYATASSIANWDEVDMKKYLPMFLEGTAAMWVKTVPASADWKLVKSLFLQTFLTACQSQFPELALHERVFQEGVETPSNYFFDKLRLCQRFDPQLTDEKKFQYIVKGLPLRWQASLVTSKHLSVSELLSSYKPIEGK